MKSYQIISNKKNTKSVIVLLSTLFVFSLLFLLLFVFNVTRISKIDINNYDVVSSDDYVFSIKECKLKDNVINIEGFIYKKNIDIKTNATHLVFKDKKDNYYKLPTYIFFDEEMVKENDYGWSGFVSTFKTNSKINMEEDFNIFVLSSINNEDKLVDLKLTSREVLENVK